VPDTGEQVYDALRIAEILGLDPDIVSLARRHAAETERQP